MTAIGCPPEPAMGVRPRATKWIKVSPDARRSCPAREYRMHPPAITLLPAASHRIVVSEALLPSARVDLSDDELLRRYDAVDGLTTGDHLAWLMSDCVEQAVSVVARWIVARRVVCLRAQGQLLLPWFQFDRTTMTPRPEVVAVVDALHEWLDDGGVATWFVTPHGALEGQWPLRALRLDPSAVLNVARSH